MMKQYQFPFDCYPNPNFRRDEFMILDGMWNFAISDSETIPLCKQEIKVPFSYETIASGIHDLRQHNSIWYEKKVSLSLKKHYYLCFLGVDFSCIVFVNGKQVGTHKGAYTQFRFDITPFIVEGENIIHVHVYDSFSKDQLRGKQRTREENYECWYEQTTGIYKTVYLETFGEHPILNAQVSADHEGNGKYRISMDEFTPLKMKIISPTSQEVMTLHIEKEAQLCGEFKIDHPLLWKIGQGNLYEVIIESKTDKVGTYFGCRTIEVDKQSILLNKEKIFEKLILNQGYYKETGLSIPSLEVLKKEIICIQNMGFNGFRMHQKIEVPHCYYYADVLGLLVWAEIPSMYDFTKQSQEEYMRECPKIIEQLHNFPSIITYVLFNESWGVPQVYGDEFTQQFIIDQVNACKKVDPTRLYIANDGWNQLSCTDILSLHEYQQDADMFYQDYASKEHLLSDYIVNTFGPCFSKGQSYNNQPIIISEFGGVSYVLKGWGYGDKAKGVEEYKKRIQALFNTLSKLDYISGYCYTQFCDVQQETNGLLDEDRHLRLEICEIKKIVEGAS